MWDYFIKLDDKTVKCKLCSKEYTYHSSTTMMSSHIASKHPQPSSSQSTMEDFTMEPRHCDDLRAEKITELIVRLITEDIMPISVVEWNDFRELMAFIEPEYTVPCRQTITTRMEGRYREIAAALRKILCKAKKVALTTDAWTGLTTESYVTITAHYFEDWTVKSAILQTRAMPERHTAENMATVLQAAVDSWGIANKVDVLVHDNATNIVSANSRYLAWESHRCFAHTLQLAINDGFNEVGAITSAVGAAARLVSHFHHSTVATQALKKKQQDQNLPDHRLIQHVKTRWNSTYDMFERVLEQRWAITAVLSDREVTKLSEARTLEPVDANWHIMEEMLPVLRSLKCATTAVCGEKDVSISTVYPITATLLSR